MSFIWNEKLISIFSYRPQRYIQRYKYGNADAEELWDAIGEVRTIVTDLVFRHSFFHQGTFKSIKNSVPGCEMGLCLEETEKEEARKKKKKKQMYIVVLLL